MLVGLLFLALVLGGVDGVKWADFFFIAKRSERLYKLVYFSSHGRYSSGYYEIKRREDLRVIIQSKTRLKPKILPGS